MPHRLRGHQGDDGAILQAGSQFGPDQLGYRHIPGPAGGIQQGRFQGTEGCRVALGLRLLIEAPEALEQRLGGRKLPGQYCRGQDLPEEGEAVAEHLPGDEGPGDPLAESRDPIISGHPEDDVVRTLVSRQVMLDRGQKAQFQVPDIQFLDDHIRPQSEI